MSEFLIGNVRGWNRLPIGEPVEVAKPGAHRFEIMTTHMASVRCVTADDEYVVGAGIGRIGIRMACDVPFTLLVTADKAAVVTIRERKVSTIAPPVNDTFATVTPRPAGPGEEIKRMMRMIQINNERREAALLNEVRRLSSSATRAAAPKEPDPSPDPVEPPLPIDPPADEPAK